MAVVINSLTPTPGFFPGATLTVAGTGFGASPGQVLLALLDQGYVASLSYGVWSATSITLVQLPTNQDLIDDDVSGLGNAAIIVLPLGAVVGGRSNPFTFVVSTSPVTEFPPDTLILGGPTATGEGFEGTEPAPIQPPLQQPLGRIAVFSNPGYDVKWSVDFEPSEDGFAQTDFSVAGASVLSNLANLGITIPLIFPP